MINLEELTKGEVFNLAGHDRGVAARVRFDVETLDLCDGSVEVIVPRSFRAVSSSFFQGMFAKSVRRVGSVEKFFDHYRFNAETHIRSRLAEYADQALAVPIN